MVHPLSIIHSEAASVIPYSAVRGIGFSKRIVKHKHLTSKRIIKAQIKIRTDRMFGKRFRNKIHSKTIQAFDLAPYKMFKVPSNSVRRFWFSAGDLSLQKRVELS